MKFTIVSSTAIVGARTAHAPTADQLHERNPLKRFSLHAGHGKRFLVTESLKVGCSKPITANCCPKGITRIRLYNSVYDQNITTIQCTQDSQNLTVTSAAPLLHVPPCSSVLPSLHPTLPHSPFHAHASPRKGRPASASTHVSAAPYRLALSSVMWCLFFSRLPMKYIAEAPA